MAATKKKSASYCFQHLSAKFALFWFWSHPITKLETDIQKWLWPELLASSKGEIQTDEKNRHTLFYNNYKYCKELNVSSLRN